MEGFDKLDLSTETLRALTQDEMAQVAGGAAYTNAGGCNQTTQSPACPSGATWFAPCFTNWSVCG